MCYTISLVLAMLLIAPVYDLAVLHRYKVRARAAAAPQWLALV